MSPTQTTDLHFKLNTGSSIPGVGLGTWQSAPNEVRGAVRFALEKGYRHIDTALNYQNEAEVGQGIKESGVPRDKIWITTKLDNHWHHRVQDGITSSLTSLGVEYVDLYLIHFPCSTDPDDRQRHLTDWNFVKTWQEMQKVLQSGKARNIGVSNFGITHLETLLHDSSCTVVPAVNQIELHPGNPSSRPKLLQYCAEKGIHCTAYSCLGSTSSPLYEDPVLLDLAKSKGKTPQQILLAWSLQRGTSVIPKSVNATRIEQNFDLNGLSLSAEEMEKLNGVSVRFKVVNDSWMPMKVFFGDD